MALPSGESWECHGILGLLEVGTIAYLIAISDHSAVARIRESTIYTITDVSLIPLSSEAGAVDHIRQERLKPHKTADAGRVSDSDNLDDRVENVAAHECLDCKYCSLVNSKICPEETRQAPRAAGPDRTLTKVLEDVFGKRTHWLTERQRVQGSADEHFGIPLAGSLKFDDKVSKNVKLGGDEPSEGGLASNSKDSRISPPATVHTLLSKLLKTTRTLLASRSFYYSYEIDITRRLGTTYDGGSHLPLHKIVDPVYFWNKHLASPFIAGHHDAFVLPVMQGFVGQRMFNVDQTRADPNSAIVGPVGAPSLQYQDIARKDGKFLMTLISRRSVKRPGLRYLRRGVDDEGYSANSVETEQLLSSFTGSSSGKLSSFTQIRGSIPLFFSQSPYSLKPVPTLHRSFAANEAAFRRHFRMLQDVYDIIEVVSLVDKTGSESEIGRLYEQSAEIFNNAVSDESAEIGFEWFDFHNVCRGMKFERVELLVDSVGERLRELGYTTEVDGRLQAKQHGVMRTNCMDCLDRTNVVQSAFGQKALEEQIKAEGLSVDFCTQSPNQWFNTLWADNGDAISRQYSSTAALKGDFTRTRRRDYRGAINDLGLSITRYYNNVVNDYFSQAAVDYLLGTVTSQVFEDFEEQMMSEDPGISMQSVRENAISTCFKIVIEDGSEEIIGGWTLLSPHQPNTLKAMPVEEVILVMTDVAIYRACLDWNDEKVSSFERVDVRSIKSVVKGTYITSVLTDAQRDEAKNIGFVVRFAGREDCTRNNQSASARLPAAKISDEAKIGETPHVAPSATRLLAFKALPASSKSAAEHIDSYLQSEQVLISSICDEIQRIALNRGNSQSNLIQNGAIITLEEARRNTGLVEIWRHSLKRAIWG